MVCVAERKRSNNVASSSTSTTPPTEEIEESNENGPSFDFENFCFLCGKEANLKLSSLLSISLVSNNKIRNTILNNLQHRDDEFSRNVTSRIENVPDLTGVNARYHRKCSMRAYRTIPKQISSGCNASHDVDDAMKDIYEYINENTDECQFTVRELANQIKGDYKPDLKTIKARLKQKYGAQIVIHESERMESVLCFPDLQYQLFLNESSRSKDLNEEDELVSSMRRAARTLRNCIRSAFYEQDSYPPTDNFMVDVFTVVPAPLQAFLEELILEGKRGSLEPWKRTCGTIAHMILSAVRPRSFFSSLKMALGCFLYRKIGCKFVISLLSSLGVSASYNEIRKYEDCLLQQPERSISESAFSQFVFDNADFNINTLDGFKTFHAMGGIQCISPSNALEPAPHLLRKKNSSSAPVKGCFANFTVQHCNREKNAGLKTLTVLDEIGETNNIILPLTGDFLWLYAKWAVLPKVPGWNGFMEQATANRSFQKTKIVFLPIIHYSDILIALQKCKATKQKICFVTFDQPLFWKANDI